MTHNDIIVDSGSHFTINPFSRTITREDDTPLVLVQGDHNSERISFDIPRLVDGHDMSKCGRVEIQYINSDSKGTESNEDSYIVDDLTAVDEDKVTFTWLVRNTATVYPGKLDFSISFICVDVETSEIVYKLNTTKYKSIVVAERCNCVASNPGAFEDLFKSWEKEAKEEIKAYTDNCIDEMAEELNTTVIKPAPLTTIGAILETNKEYNIGGVAELALVFPTIANDGDVIYLAFKSGETATTLSIDITNTTDIEIIPEPNCYYDIFAKFNGSVWLVNYSEYLVSEV